MFIVVDHNMYPLFIFYLFKIIINISIYSINFQLVNELELKNKLLISTSNPIHPRKPKTNMDGIGSFHYIFFIVTNDLFFFFLFSNVCTHRHIIMHIASYLIILIIGEKYCWINGMYTTNIRERIGHNFFIIFQLSNGDLLLFL
ncbi:hypothetical protein ACJX0J_032373, partial [Zea mays]